MKSEKKIDEHHLTQEEKRARKREYDRRYRAKYPEKQLEKCARYRAKHRKELSIKSRDAYRKNPTKRLASCNKYRMINRDKVLAYGAKYREENREWINEKRRKRYDKNQDKEQESSLRRYHADKTNPQKLESTKLGKYRLMRNENIKVFGGKCAACQSTRVLQFHHLYYGEEGMLGIKPSIERKIKFMEEVQKYPDRFQMLCAKCHIIVTNKQIYDEWRKNHPML